MKLPISLELSYTSSRADVLKGEFAKLQWDRASSTGGRLPGLLVMASQSEYY